MNRRRLLLVGGVVAFGGAVVEIATPGSIFRLPIDEAVIYVLGGTLLLYAYYVFSTRQDVTFEQINPPTPETRVAVSPPGDNLDDTLRRFLRGQQVHLTRQTVEGLRAAAVEVLTWFLGLSETDAKARVESGTWTDDPYAADFLASGSLDLPPVGQFRKMIAPESSYQLRTRHTVSAIVNVARDVPADEKTNVDDGGGFRWMSGLLSGPSSDIAMSIGTVEPEAEVGRGGYRETNHWFGVSLFALAALGVGVVVRQPAVLLIAVVGVGYAAYAWSSSLNSPRLAVERAVSDETPSLGDDVEVTVTVKNEGESAIFDLRLVDGVPQALSVVDGTPRSGAALRSGESIIFSYTVAARRGRHEFKPLLAIARDLPGALERDVRVKADPSPTITCIPPLEPVNELVPLRQPATQFAGHADTDTGGEGTEFYATRRYQQDDAVGRVDWRRFARTGELATLQFREERAASVVLLIDARPSAYVAPNRDGASALDRAVEAAGQVFARLLDDGHRVGIATMGNEDCWLAPSSGSDNRARGRTLLATDPALSSIPPAEPYGPVRWKRRLRRRLQQGMQLIVFTPLWESATVEILKRYDTYGYPVTVISPDPTVVRNPGHRLVHVRRRIHLMALRRARIPVVDWAWDTSLEKALLTVRHAQERGNNL